MKNLDITEVMAQENQVKNPNVCLNCQSSIEDSYTYCHDCGQRTRKSRLSVWYFVSDFFGSVFNLDSRFFKTFRKIIFPARLASEYMQGKRKSYLNPARFFFFCLIVHFAALAYIISNSGLAYSVEKFKQENATELSKSEMAIEFDSLVAHNPGLDTSMVSEIRDSLFGNVNDKYQDTFVVLQNFQVSSQVNLSKYAITTKDFMTLTPREMDQKYGISDFWERTFLRQMKKMWNDPYGTIQYVVGNFLWVIVLQVIFAALFLKIIYIRRSYYFVEHLIISMSYHSIALLLMSIVYLSVRIESADGTFNNVNIDYISYYLPNVALLGAFLYAFFSLKNFYRQGYFKTFIKFLLLCFCELILVITFASIILMISMFIF